MEVVRLLPDVLFRCYKADDGKIYWSLNEGGLAERFGLTTKEIEGKSLDELFPGGASEALHEHFEDAFRGRPTVFTNEIEGRHFRHFPQPVFDDDGNVKEVVGFIADVTELVEAERALADANRELEAFAHTVSHDLRSPLTTLSMDAEMLRTRLPQGTREQGMAERMTHAARRLIRLVEALLWLSRASTNEPERRDVDLSALAGEVVEGLRASDPDRRVEVDVEPGLQAHVDPDLANALLQNLLGNAWKFTLDKDPARIALRRDGDAFVLEDNGPGFEPGDADRIFQAFTRLSGRFEGSGIGLATVQRIVERHGGTIEAEGRPGEGATFRFTLPAAGGPGEGTSADAGADGPADAAADSPDDAD